MNTDMVNNNVRAFRLIADFISFKFLKENPWWAHISTCMLPARESLGADINIHDFAYGDGLHCNRKKWQENWILDIL